MCGIEHIAQYLRIRGCRSVMWGIIDLRVIRGRIDFGHFPNSPIPPLCHSSLGPCTVSTLKSGICGDHDGINSCKLLFNEGLIFVKYTVELGWGLSPSVAVDTGLLCSFVIQLYDFSGHTPGQKCIVSTTVQRRVSCTPYIVMSRALSLSLW